MLSARIEHFKKHKTINPKHTLTTIDIIAKAPSDDPSLLEYKNLLTTTYGIGKIDTTSISSIILAFYEQPSLKIKNEINEQLSILLKKLPYSKKKYTLVQAIDLFKEEKKRHIERKKEQIKAALKNIASGSIAAFEFSLLLAKIENRSIDLSVVKTKVKNSLKCYEQKITDQDLIAFEAQLLSTLRVDEAFKNASSLNISTNTLSSSTLSASSSINDIRDSSARNSLVSDDTASRDSFIESGTTPRNSYLSDSGISPRDGYLSDSSPSPRSGYLSDSSPSPRSGYLSDNSPSPRSGYLSDNSPSPRSGYLSDNSPSPSNGYLSDNNASPRNRFLSESENPRSPSLNDSNANLPHSNYVFLTTKTQLSRKKSSVTIGAKNINQSTTHAPTPSAQKNLTLTATTASNTDPITKEKVCDELADCIERLSMMDTSNSNTSPQTRQTLSDSAPEVKQRKSLTMRYDSTNEGNSLPTVTYRIKEIEKKSTVISCPIPRKFN
ncbi:MAG: hypothetical protein JSS07_09430 [Proteobacteria bacterium]|nr:hypothetical protein [Pseudomonadota bacterium]